LDLVPAYLDIKLILHHAQLFGDYLFCLNQTALSSVTCNLDLD
jgi:hypothetical protein